VIPGFSLEDMLNPKRNEPNKKTLKSALDKKMFPFRKSKFQKTENHLKEATLQRAIDSMKYQDG
jgi:hypothetical protein